MLKAEDIIKTLGLEANDVLNIYIYGSFVHGCVQNHSDIDCMIISRKQEDPYQLNCDNIDAKVYNVNDFQALLDAHDISALECYFLPDSLKLLEQHVFDLKLDLEKLNLSISNSANNSYVDAKKRLTISKDYNPNVAKKSLFYSIRILVFGSQIAKYKKIINYTAANIYWGMIMTNTETKWEGYNNLYNSIFNELSTVFKKGAQLL